MVSHDQISGAVVWFLTNGSPKGAPIISRVNVVNHYGIEQADALIVEVTRLLQEVLTIPVDWSNQSWQEAGDYVRDSMKDRHPFLSDEAVGRLRGYFMYQTK